MCWSRKFFVCSVIGYRSNATRLNITYVWCAQFEYSAWSISAILYISSRCNSHYHHNLISQTLTISTFALPRNMEIQSAPSIYRYPFFKSNSKAWFALFKTFILFSVHDYISYFSLGVWLSQLTKISILVRKLFRLVKSACFILPCCKIPKFQILIFSVWSCNGRFNDGFNVIPLLVQPFTISLLIFLLLMA